jgi:hypothetical protein
MVKEYEPDLAIAPLVITTSAVDAHVAIPQNLPGSILSNPRDTGSLYNINVDGNPASLKFSAAGTPAVFGTDPVYEVGNCVLGSQPVRIPPGTVVHAINAATKTGTVSIVRYRRAT